MATSKPATQTGSSGILGDTIPGGAGTDTTIDSPQPTELFTPLRTDLDYPMLREEQSERINCLRFPLIVLVVMIHNYDTNILTKNLSMSDLSTDYTFDFIRILVSQGIARTAVPVFFLISGYLFFINFTPDWRTIGAKLTNRTRTLLAPLIFWNGLTLALFFSAEHIPQVSGYLAATHDRISDFGLYEILDAIFGFDKNPIAYQFWFIRDLIILILASPAIFLVLRYIAPIAIPVMLAIWGGNFWLSAIPSPEATLFFCLGGALGIHRKNIMALDRWGAQIGALYIILVVWDTAVDQGEIHAPLHKIGVLFGVAFSLFATRWIIRHERVKKSLLLLNQSSFFVYAAHEPLLTFTRKAVFRVTHPDTTPALLLFYFVIPAVLIVFLVLLHKVLLRLAPGLTRFATGRA